MEIYINVCKNVVKFRCVNSFVQSAAMEIGDQTSIARETAPIAEVKLQNDKPSANEKLKIADFVKNKTYHRKHNDGKSLTNLNVSKPFNNRAVNQSVTLKNSTRPMTTPSYRSFNLKRSRTATMASFRQLKTMIRISRRILSRSLLEFR